MNKKNKNYTKISLHSVMLSNQRILDNSTKDFKNLKAFWNQLTLLRIICLKPLKKRVWFKIFRMRIIRDQVEKKKLVNLFVIIFYFGGSLGRTDKGVSALGNVISLDIRTSIRKDEDGLGEINSLNYDKMLNGCLPDETRFIGQARVKDNFSARYDTKSRIYKYFFMIENMDIERIKVKII